MYFNRWRFLEGCIFCWFVGLSLSFGKQNTSIASERMELLRFPDHNTFTFDGNVEIKADRFYGSCNHMEVRTQSEQQARAARQYVWCYGCQWTVRRTNYHWFHAGQLLADKKQNLTDQMGQLQLIVATGDVVLKIEDANSGEIRQATSQKAVIYPNEGKLVLMGHPVVRCSVQGLFRGDKITFFRDSERVVVENNRPGERSQVLLSE